LTLAAAFLLFLTLAPSLSAQTARAATPAALVFPRLVPDEKAALFSHSGDYTWEELRDIALWASWTNDPAPRRSIDYASLINQAVTRLTTELAALDPEQRDDPRIRAEYVLTFLHKNYLTRYNSPQTRLDTILISKRYNCVSSAVFYVILAKAVGLDVAAVVTKDHAFATVRISSPGGNVELIDVETTNRYGFDPGNRKEFHNAFGDVTGFAYVSPKNYRDRAEINTLELVSLILSNRVTELEQTRRFGDAVPLAIDRAALLSRRDPVPNATLFASPATDVRNRIFNYGADLLNGRKEADCLRWADTAAPLFPDDDRWTTFTDSAVNNMVSKALQSQKPDEAAAILEKEGHRLSPSMKTRLTSVIAQADQVALHNAFATQYNRRNFEAALQILTAALTKYPDSKQLTTDMEIVQRALQQSCSVYKITTRIGLSLQGPGLGKWLR
jgi:hypothetical protein